MNAEKTGTSAPPEPVKPPSKPKGKRAPLDATWAIVALLLGLALGRFACASGTAAPGQHPSASGAATAAEQDSTVWTCSMHPQVQRPEPGQCPICGMDLIPLKQGDGLDPSALEVSENAAALAEIATTPVVRRSVSREVRMVGRVAFDETRMAYITAWVPSRIDRMFVDYTGITVRKGDHLVDVYSPKLIATQQELLGAVRSSELIGDGSVDVVRERQAASVQSARDRLRLWGLQSDQIDAIVANGKPLEHITINAPTGGVVIHKSALQGDYVDTGTRIYTIADLKHVWVQLDAYESDLQWLHYGQKVEFETEAYAGKTFHGRISFIDPVLDDHTRTVKVRLNVGNTDLRLKPDMFVRATVHAPMTALGELVDQELSDMSMCPMHPEIVQGAPGICEICGMDLVPTAELGFHSAQPGELPLVIPDTAPLVTGTRAVVYVRRPGDGPPVFEGRVIVLGPRAEGEYVVESGLSEGELVVVQGAFKLDSELQIRARPSMMSQKGGQADSGQQDGGGLGSTSTSATPQALSTPEAFRADLGGLIDPAVAAATALAADDSAAATAAGQRFGEALAAVSMVGLEDEVHRVWMPLANTLGQAAEQLTQDGSIEDQRAALTRLDDALIQSLQSFGWTGAEQQLSVFHCPMAFDGEGADWLGLGDKVANPYYGQAMPRCGKQRTVLTREP